METGLLRSHILPTTCCHNIKMLISASFGLIKFQLKWKKKTMIIHLDNKLSMNTWYNLKQVPFTPQRTWVFYTVLPLIYIVSVSKQEIGSDRKVCLSVCRSFYRCQTWTEWIGRLTQAPWELFFFLLCLSEEEVDGRSILQYRISVCVCVCVWRKQSS